MAFKKMTGSENPNEIALAGSGYNIRFNCQIGACTKNNGEEKIEGNLEIVILGYDQFTGALQVGGKPPGDVYDWVQIWFVGAPKESKIPKNIVCNALLKTQSAASFLNCYQANYHNKPQNLIWCPKYVKKAGPGIMGQKTSYYTVEWTIRERAKDEEPQLKLIEEFTAKEIELIDFNCPVVKIPDFIEGSIVQNTLPNVEIPPALEAVKNI